MDKVPRLDLGCFPTPVHPLARLSQVLGGPQLVIKRDDLTGLGGGGNKVRKLEYLLADALQQGATTVITTGAPQSNHARQTAAAAARCGLGSILVLQGMAPATINGNLLLDRLLGARLLWSGDRSPDEVMEEVAELERAAGRKPYVIPYGGSNAIGASGYVVAMHEAARQFVDHDLKPDYIVVPTSSGGTLAGLVVGARAVNYQGRIVGISVSSSTEKLKPTVLELARLTTEYLGFRFEIEPSRFQILDDYLGPGYGILTDEIRQTIQLVARTEGILLDPVYTGKAMSGLMALIREGAFERHETVLFWHTGGTPALYAYADLLLR